EPQIVEQPGVRGRAGERTLVMVDGRGKLPALAPTVAQMEQRFGIVRVEAQRLVPGALGGVCVAAVDDFAEQVPGRGIAGIKGERGAAGGSRALVAAEPLQARALAQQVGATRGEGDGRIEPGERASDFAGFERQAGATEKLVGRQRTRRGALDGPVAVLESLAAAARAGRVARDGGGIHACAPGRPSTVSDARNPAAPAMRSTAASKLRV